MKIRFLLFTLSFFLIQECLAQLSTNPQLPVATQKVTIIFDSSKESRLGFYSGDLYAHTGVIVEGSADWKHVIGSWGNNTTQPKLTAKGNGIYELEISPDINTYYSVLSAEKVTRLAFVFRSADGTKQTSDLFADVYQEGLVVRVGNPAGNSILNKNQPLAIIASASVDATLKLFLDGSLLAQTTGKTIATDYTFLVSGEYWVIAEAAVADQTRRDSVYVCVRQEVVQQARPGGWQKGINYPSETSAGLVLWAPEKEFVYVLGDFNNWRPANSFQMKKEGDYFWLEIPGLVKGKPYVFQYLVDGQLKVADPYTEQTSDPNDQWISTTTYPGLIVYPAGKADGVASVLQPGQPAYSWEVTNFQPPQKEKMVIYELLVRDFTDQHTFRAVMEKLDYLADLRVNVLELMPVNEFEGNSSWGYNPSFYFAPDKYYGPKNDLKKLVDECHKRGIAVVIDLVLNHSYGQSPLVKLYWDSVNNRPAANNPWYNPQHNFQNPDAQWGFDFNHESAATRQLVDSINSFWMNEYRIDGFRFDFTKGFSNTVYGPTSWGSNYDAARIANLKRMTDEIKKRKPGAIVIFEHLADNSEEKELADYGILLWGNMNYNYGEGAMGYTENSKSDLTWGVYSSRNWQQPNLVTYMESHDEERITYKCLQYGKTEGSYSTTSLTTALARMELNSLFLLPLPGPKMIWQFGELGYDISIDFGGRLGEKPVKWDYLEHAGRTHLFQTMAKLNHLKQNYAEFTPQTYTGNLTGEVKWYRLSNGSNHVLAVGNFSTSTKTATLTFPATGTWYDFFGKTFIVLETVEKSFTLAPGEYRLFSNRQFTDPHVVTQNFTIEGVKRGIELYPNPATDRVVIRSDQPVSRIEMRNMAGQVISSTRFSAEQEVWLPVATLPRGIYLVQVFHGNRVSARKLVVQ